MRGLLPGVLALAAGFAASAGLEAAGRPASLPSMDGTPLSAQIYEASSRPAPGVVLVHMLARSKADWDEVANQLQEAGLTALAIDLRGHGSSGGSASMLPTLAQDVRAAVQWLSVRPGVRAGVIGIAGASLGANLALVAAADEPVVRAVALVSPSTDYRGVRVDGALLKKLGDRPIWMAASVEDPLSLRTLKELSIGAAGTPEQRLTSAVAHGTNLLRADRDLSRALVDWLRRTLLF